MLVFLTTVRHPLNSSDYRRVEQLLQRTLSSIAAQTSDAFRVVVVANEVPSFALPPHVEVVQVDFPPPSATSSARTGQEAVLIDKGTKLAVGLLAARAHAPTHTFAVDADDLVSRRLARLVELNPTAAGWYVAAGYVYSETRRVLRRLQDFDHRCGSSLLTSWDLWRVPDLPLTASQAEIVEAFGSFQVRELLGSHVHLKRYAAECGRPLEALPFPGAIYVTGTGENHSGNDFRRLGHRVTPAVAAEFTLPASSRSNALRHAIAWSGVRHRIARWLHVWPRA